MKAQPGGSAEPKTSGFHRLLQANLVFWAILLLAGIMAFFVCGAVWDDAVKGLLTFLFLVLGGGFTLVSVMDHLYEKQARTGNE